MLKERRTFAHTHKKDQQRVQRKKKHTMGYDFVSGARYFEHRKLRNSNNLIKTT